MGLVEENSKSVSCKYCGSNSIFKCGSYNNVQRYWCKACKRKFKVDDHLFHLGIPAQCVYTSLEMRYGGTKINAIRQYLKQEFGYLPSRSAIYQWLQKFTDRAVLSFQDPHVQVGDTWIIGENMRKLTGKHQKIKVYDIVDAETHFLLATRISFTRSRLVIKKLIEEAERKSGKRPCRFVTLIPYSYFDRIEPLLGANVEYLHFPSPQVQNHNRLIACFDNVCKPRYKIIRTIKNNAILNSFINGWYLYYNYFQTQSELENKTPAEAAGIDYTIKSWKDFVSDYSFSPTSIS